MNQGKDFRGLSDSSASSPESPEKCDRCGATARLDKGICVNCLLLEGLQANGEGSSEVFENVLAEVNLPDKEWRLGNYEILEEIGRGGMGVIYRARQRHSRRIVAVKRMLSYEAESHDTLARFRREAETASSLDHPNILPIYEVSESEEGVPFFSMKLATGGSLRVAGPSISSQPRERVRLIAKVAQALDYAHQRGILHRDLQPGNILLDARGEPMISDFGLAKWLGGESDLTRTLTTFGTPGYIAPEQAEGAAAELTPAADVYSLGAILFNLLAGRPPFVGANALSVIRQAAVAEAPRLRSLAPTLDRDLETIVAHCLERDPKARYQSAGDLAEDLERWLAGRPIGARRVLIPIQLWRWARRNPILAATASGCLLLAAAVAWLVGGIGLNLRTAFPQKSIAVLPFENLTADQEGSFFANGMQDDILTDLAKIAELKVISRSSVREFTPSAPRNLREIARLLGVRHVLEGSVHRMEGRVRISAHLTDTKTGAQLWAQQFDRELSDVFAIQDQIAREIAVQLAAHLSPQERATIQTKPTTDIRAYDLFLQARELFRDITSSNQERMLRELTLLEEAIARDPKFVKALCAAARAHLELYWFNHDHSATRLALATKALDEAARLEPEAGEVHFTRGILQYWGHRDYTSALTELAFARRTLPNETDIPYFIALIERRRGNWGESTRQLEQARTIDPRNATILFDLARADYFECKRYQEAAQLCESVLEWKPHDFRFEQARAKVDIASRADLQRYRVLLFGDESVTAPPDSLAEARLELALWDRDFRAARKALAEYPLPDFRNGGFVVPKEFYDGLIALRLGEQKRAEAALESARAKVTAFIALRPNDARAHISLADINARLGRKEEAIRGGEHAVELRPVERDGMEGPVILTGLASIYAQVGENARALDILARVAKLPMGMHYGYLVLDDDWDPLRSEPRFRDILQSLAPKPTRSL